MSNALLDETDAESFLRDGDELVFVNRPRPLKTVVQILRNKQVLMWKAPNGDWYPGYRLDERLDWTGCEAYAERMAAESGLIVDEVFEAEGELHVRLRKQQG